MSETASPERIERIGDSALRISWNDGTVQEVVVASLRKACPCATCREKRSGEEQKKQSGKSLALPVLTQAELQPLRVVSMSPVGNYAYNISFSDGHGSGLYPFQLIRELGREVTSS